MWLRSGECLCEVWPPGVSSSPRAALLVDATSCDMGGVVETVRNGDRLGAGTTVTIPVDPAEGLISSARGGGSH